MKKVLVFLLISCCFLLIGCEKEKTYGLNDKIYVTNSLGEYSIQFISAERTKSSKNENVVVVTYELENRSISSDLNKDEWHFMATDKKGNDLKNYLILSEANKKAKLGETIKVKIGYFFDSDTNYVKLKYFDDYKSSEANAVFEIEW